MKYAHIYKRRGKLFMGAQGKTTAGALIGVGAPTTLDADVDPSTIGRSLREVLSRSKSPLQHPQPSQWPMIMDAFLKAIGIKTWGAFVRGALLSTVETDDSSVRFQPHENRGAREAFQPMSLPIVSVAADASDQELGAAVLRALSIAESREPHRM